MSDAEQKRRVTVVIEVNSDAEDDLPIADVVRWALEGNAIDTDLGERIVSLDVTDI